MLAAVLGLTAYAALTGGDHRTPAAIQGSQPSTPVPSSPEPSASAKPVPMYSAPSTWTEPARWIAVPRGSRKAVTGREVGFPNTAEGAIGMMVAASGINVEGTTTLPEQQLAVALTYMAQEDQSSSAQERVQQGAQRTEAAARTSLGLPSSGPLPRGAFMRTTMIAFKPILVTATQVTTYVLMRVTDKAGELQEEQTIYTTGILGAAWLDGDWKLSGQAIKSAAAQAGQKPAIAAPGDAAFNTEGWTAIRQAS
ncbi:hypothetical protein [Kitasatospora sp. NPDC093558]|uniref:hypothetical protein n=1 Tax=Kitasatospora sp. NPDC093558 TaxID=3155201 RepID=UPI003430BE9E